MTESTLNDLGTLTGAPIPIEADGERHLVHPLDVGELGKLQAWVDRQFPDPFHIADCAIAAREAMGRPYNVVQQQFLLKQAMELAAKGRRLLGTPEADEKARSAEGMAYLIYLTVAKGEPEFTEADATRFYRKLTGIGLAKMLIASNVNMVLSDPKADATPGTEPS